MQEIWKPVKGMEDYFEISNLGRIKRISYIHGNGNKKKTIVKCNRILKTTIDRGYEKIILSCNNTRRITYIHRLVAEAFIPNPQNFKEINHKDNNSMNNRVENLEWCDRRYNLDYMIKHQREIKDRHERRIETLETILYYAETQPFVDSELIKKLITDDMIGDF